MNKKKIILGIIGMIALFFVLVMVFSSNEFVQSLDQQHTKYLSNKKIQVSGKIIAFEKVSGKNKLIEIQPSFFQNTPIKTEPYTTIGFVNKDTSKIYVIAPIPKSISDVDSLTYTIKEVVFFQDNQEISRQTIQPMRWNIMQSEKLKLEKKLKEKLHYLY